MSPFGEFPVHLIVALSVASGSPFGLDERGTIARQFERAASRATPVARQSDAPSGPYLFSADAWLAAIGFSGPPTVAARIFRTSAGRRYMPIGAERDAVLSLRDDPELAAVMVRSAAARDRPVVARLLGRPPTTGELLLAHLLGTGAAIAIVERTRTAPREALSGQPDLDGAALRVFAAKRPGMTAADLYGGIAGVVDRQLARATGGMAPGVLAAQRRPWPPGSWSTTVARGPATPAQ